MTKSRKRREAEARKASETAPPEPVNHWSIVEKKKVSYRPQERTGKPQVFIQMIPTASGKAIRKRHIFPAQRQEGQSGNDGVVLKPLGFPCARIIMIHAVSRNLVKLSFSERNRVEMIERGIGPNRTLTERKYVARTYSVCPVEQDEDGRYVPIKPPETMGETLFDSYTLQRFGMGLSKLLEVTAHQPDEN